MRKLSWNLVIGLCCFCTGSCGDGGGAKSQKRLLILSADSLSAAAKAFADYRSGQGFLVERSTMSQLRKVFPADSLEQSIRLRVAQFGKGIASKQLLFVLLIGDADEQSPEDNNLIPIARGYEGFLGDSPYVDLDQDEIPDFAIGRLPFRGLPECEMYLARIRDYEAVVRPGPWNKVMPVFQGNGGFGGQIDGMLEYASDMVFDELSYQFDLFKTQANPASFCFLPPQEYQKEYAKRYLEGAPVIPYIGHTMGTAFCCESEEPNRRGLIGFFSCLDGAFQTGDASQPYTSLGEQLLLRTQGPVATLGATTLSHPYGNVILPRELGYLIIEQRPETYGEAVTVAKYNMVHRTGGLRELIDNLAKQFVPEPLDYHVYSHIVMYNLLGDPALPIHLPKGSIELSGLNGPITPGTAITLNGIVTPGDAQSPMANGEVVVTLEIQRSIPLTKPDPRLPDNYDPGLCQKNHQVANDKIAASASGAVINGAFSVEIAVPAKLTEAQYFLKAYSHDDHTDAVGSMAVVIY